MSAVVLAAAGPDDRVVELLVGDHREQRLRQVVVDVRVHPEQEVAQHRLVGVAAGVGERHPPGPGHRAAVEVVA